MQAEVFKDIFGIQNLITKISTFKHHSVVLFITACDKIQFLLQSNNNNNNEIIRIQCEVEFFTHLGYVLAKRRVRPVKLF